MDKMSVKYVKATSANASVYVRSSIMCVIFMKLVYSDMGDSDS